MRVVPEYGDGGAARQRRDDEGRLAVVVHAQAPAVLAREADPGVRDERRLHDRVARLQNEVELVRAVVVDL
jgi:hypothetical protein